MLKISMGAFIVILFALVEGAGAKKYGVNKV